MSAANWLIVKDLLDSCLDRPPSERARYLQSACDDPEIAAEVSSLLAAHESASEDFLEETAPAQGRFFSAFGDDALTGQKIGAYRLTHEVGRGGMGTVYRAVRDDDEFSMVVAIKIVSRGMDTESVLKRFRTERQILASLEHPNIARILDGGSTPYGLPYFVMEFVDGVPLTTYCDQHCLTLAERLQLFRRVCNAVAHAHENFVIHRDLKPGNILVTPDGVPKLLDFGIAKIIRGGAEAATLTGPAMATPAYASPEQIRGAAIGVASDIYSLGVILYELLTGHRPYRIPSQNSDEVARIICEREPTKASTVVTIRETIANVDGPTQTIDPSEISEVRRTTVTALKRSLQGDLDTIVSMALRKEADRRYKSVAEFNEDLGRYLDGQPILARKDTLAYRAAKFAGRHPISLGLSAAAVIVLMTLAAYAGWEARKLSNRVAQDHQLASSFLFDVHDAIANLPGSTPVREKLLRKSLEYLNGLGRDAGEDPALHRSLAAAYEKFAELQAGATGAGLGKSLEAFETVKKAQAIREMLAKDSTDERAQYELANNYLLTASIVGRVAVENERTQYDRKAIKIAERLAASQPKNPEYVDLLARAHASLAYALAFYDRWDESRKHFQSAVALRINAVATSKDPVKAERDLARAYYRFGASYARAGRSWEALGYLKNALEIQERLRKARPKDEVLTTDTSRTLHFLGVALRGTGNYKASLSSLDQAIAIRGATVAKDSYDVRSQTLLAGNYAERGSSYMSAGQLDSGLHDLQLAVGMQTTILDGDPRGASSRLAMADYEGRLAEIHSALARRASGEAAKTHWREAAKYYRRSDALYVALSGEGLVQSTQIRADAKRAADGAAEAARHIE